MCTQYIGIVLVSWARKCRHVDHALLRIVFGERNISVIDRAAVWNEPALEVAEFRHTEVDGEGCGMLRSMRILVLRHL